MSLFKLEIERLKDENQNLRACQAQGKENQLDSNTIMEKLLISKWQIGNLSQELFKSNGNSNELEVTIRKLQAENGEL